MPSETLLDAGAVAAYLVGRGVLPAGRPATVRALGGGVSNVVLLVECDGRQVVVKQSLPMLKVAEEWYAEPGRVVTEAAALRVAERLIPGSVPMVLDIDDADHAITLSAAVTTSSWKDELLRGDVNVAVARGLGEWLGQ